MSPRHKALSWRETNEWEFQILSKQDFTLALDAMGGDKGPEIVIPAAALAIQRYPNMKIIFFGDESRIAPLLAQYPKLESVAKIRHAEVSIAMHDKPSQALRRGRNKSGMWQAIDAVHTGQAAAVVSAGNTGALMAMSRFILRSGDLCFCNKHGSDYRASARRMSNRHNVLHVHEILFV